MGKQVFDLLMAIIVLTLLSPLLIILAVAIRLNMGHPVLFRQLRPGSEGASWRCWKNG